MTVRFYVMPMVLITTDRGQLHLRKYFPYSYRTSPDGVNLVNVDVTGPPLEPEPSLAVVPFHLVDQGIADVCLMAADMTAAQHTLLSSKTDVDAIPANLDNTIGAQLATVKTRMRAWNIPANWLTSTTTYRQLV